MSLQRSSDGGPQKCGRFTVFSQPVEPDADEADRGSGSADTSAPSARAERAQVEHAAAADQPSKIESLHKLQAILEAQHHLFTKTWEDMKDQVYTALLHKDGGNPQPQQAAQPDTPTSTHSTSSCRTPPGQNGGESRCGDRVSVGSSAASNWTPAAGSGQSDNARESTLQTWSHLGSTLREVVHRNEQLEEENRCLRMDLVKLQQRIEDAQQRLAPPAPPPPGSPRGLVSEGQLSDGAPPGPPP
mmetsp:Transcript_28367/g.90256  ORF Transcript_28367/g.90256 Transcript_28367/m.90256 type:complete len:244 (+) Transcript_28367:86-817(+)